MLKKIRELPHREIGISYVKSFCNHRCDPIFVGLSIQKDSANYQFDNRERNGGVLFQYTLAGEGHFCETQNNREVVLSPGTAFLIPFPSPTKYWLTPGGIWEFIYIVFTGDLAWEQAGLLISDYGYCLKMPLESAPLEVLLELYMMVSRDHAPDECTASILTYRFLMELRRFLQAPPAPIPDEIDQARAFFESHYSDGQVSVDDAAAISGYSKFHFSRLFKQYTGFSPHMFLVRIRLRHALRLITSGGLPIKEIAQRVGFNDYPYFCHVFKKHMQATPMTVRKYKERFRLSRVLAG